MFVFQASFISATHNELADSSIEIKAMDSLLGVAAAMGYPGDVAFAYAARFYGNFEGNRVRSLITSLLMGHSFNVK